MALTTAAIYLIGRTHPEIFDLLGNPYGPYRLKGHHAAAELNPQPLPPAALSTGFAAAGELVRGVLIADRSGGRYSIDFDDWCGTPPKRPPFTWPPAPWPPKRGDFEEDIWGEYNLGFAVGLEASAGLWADSGFAGELEQLHDAALGLAAKGGTNSRVG
jgi:hypothetical protein